MNEKIGMYTTDEIFDYMTNRESSMLGRSMYDAIMQQLQAYKDKEDKLRETLLVEIRWQNGIGEILVEKKLREILQILNEGSDK